MLSSVATTWTLEPGNNQSTTFTWCHVN